MAKSNYNKLILKIKFSFYGRVLSLVLAFFALKNIVLLRLYMYVNHAIAFCISDFYKATELHRMRYAVEYPPLRNRYENNSINQQNLLRSAESGGCDKHLYQPIRLD